MRRLALVEPGPGYCHFPAGRDADWFRQLTVEKLVTRYVKGFPVREWHKTEERNEALDCRVYALAALKIAASPFKRAAERLRAEREALAEAARARVGRQPVMATPEPGEAGGSASEGLVTATAGGANGVAVSSQEKPQEEIPPRAADTAPIKRRAAPARRRGGWVHNW